MCNVHTAPPEFIALIRAAEIFDPLPVDEGDLGGGGWFPGSIHFKLHSTFNSIHASFYLRHESNPGRWHQNRMPYP